MTIVYGGRMTLHMAGAKIRQMLQCHHVAGVSVVCHRGVIIIIGLSDGQIKYAAKHGC